MTSAAISPDQSDEGSEIFFGDVRDEVFRRAEAANLQVERKVQSFASRETAKQLVAFFPNGREQRKFIIGAPRAHLLLRSNFEHWTLLSDYLAFLDRKDNIIEASIRIPTGIRWLLQLPGVIQAGDMSMDNSELEDVETDPANGDSGVHPIDPDKHWVLPIGGSTYEVEISPCSHGAQALDRMHGSPSPSNRAISLKIRNVAIDRHDEAVGLLERLSSALFFEIDLLCGGVLQLVRDDGTSPGPPSSKGRRDTPVRMPRVQYAREAIALYEYGRLAPGTPLLEFLAYYQTIEFFFPLFSRQEALRRIRRELADPRFDVNDDSDLHRIFELASNSSRSFGSERDQLKDTLGSILDDSRMMAFVKESEEREKFLTEGKKLKGVHVINPRDSGRPVLHQVADRVYDIRCRIVHTKEDGGAPGLKMLVPGSSESRLLGHDIELVRFLAQKAILAGGKPAPW